MGEEIHANIEEEKAEVKPKLKAKDFDSYPWVFLSLGIVIGIVGGYVVFDFVTPQEIPELQQLIDQDILIFTNPNTGEVTEFTSAEVLFALVQETNNVQLTLGVLQEQRLCGTNSFVTDSNRTNEIPSGIIYSCFVADSIEN